MARSLGIIMKKWDNFTKRLGKLIGTESKKPEIEASLRMGIQTQRVAGGSTSVHTSDKWPFLHLKRRKNTPNSIVVTRV